MCVFLRMNSSLYIILIVSYICVAFYTTDGFMFISLFKWHTEILGESLYYPPFREKESYAESYWPGWNQGISLILYVCSRISRKDYVCLMVPVSSRKLQLIGFVKTSSSLCLPILWSDKGFLFLLISGLLHGPLFNLSALPTYLKIKS